MMFLPDRHDAKAEANLQAHGVSFELAKSVFEDLPSSFSTVTPMEKSAL
jgi:uncharacterized DUF497 family protein